MIYMKELEEVEKFIAEIEQSLKQIKNEMERSDLEAQVFLVKLKHERLRAMTAAERSRSILANMEIIVAKTEIGLAVSSLGSSSNPKSLEKKKRSETLDNAPSPKKKKVTSEQEKDKQKSKSSARSSSKTSKENVKKNTTKDNTKKSQSKTPPSLSINKSMPCSIPMQNLTNFKFPAGCKRTIFLENPPVKDTSINKNIGYYTTAYTHEVLGYNPDTVSRAQIERKVCKQVAQSVPRKQANCSQVNSVPNLTITPQYNLKVPGNTVQHQTQLHSNSKTGTVNQSNISINNQFFDSCKQEDTSFDGQGENNCESTNKLFQELMGHKGNDVKADDMRSLASEETLVITMNLEDFQHLSPEF